MGNRITDVTTGGSTVSRTQYYSNTSNRLNDIWENGAQLRVYTYDGAGNTLTENRPGEAFAFTYNKRNRLASVTRNGSLWGTYVYNAFEQLVSRTSPAPAAPLGTVHYIHDLDGHLIAEADGATGATLRDYVWLPSNDNEVQDLPLAVIDGVNTATPVTSFIHTDHLGRPTRMTNAAKATVWQAVWTPWGEAQSMTGSVTNNLRFPGQYFQIETGLNYNHHRTYDPVTGRYTQPDPLGFVDGPSVYVYAGNSPWMNVDREGQNLFKKLRKKTGELLAIPAGGIAAVGVAWWFWDDHMTAEHYLQAFWVGASVTTVLFLEDLVSGVGKKLRKLKRGKRFKEFLNDDGGAVKIGRAGKQKRLRELLTDDKISSADRGWIRQELN